MLTRLPMLAATLGVFLTLPANAQDRDTPVPPVLELPSSHNPEPVVRTRATPPPNLSIVTPKPKTEAQLRAEALFEERQDGFVRNRDIFGLATLGMDTAGVVALCAEVRSSYLDHMNGAESALDTDARSRMEVFDRRLRPLIANYESTVTPEDWAQKRKRGGQALGLMTMMLPPAVEAAVDADPEGYTSGERSVMEPFMNWLVEECVTEDFAERDAFMAEMEVLTAE